MVAGTARLFGDHPVEAKRYEFKRIDEGIHYAHWVISVDVVINRLGKKRRLRPIRTFDESPHPILPLKFGGIVHLFVRIGLFSHSLSEKRLGIEITQKTVCVKFVRNLRATSKSALQR